MTSGLRMLSFVQMISAAYSNQEIKENRGHSFPRSLQAGRMGAAKTSPSAEMPVCWKEWEGHLKANTMGQANWFVCKSVSPTDLFYFILFFFQFLVLKCAYSINLVHTTYISHSTLAMMFLLSLTKGFLHSPQTSSIRSLRSFKMQKPWTHPDLLNQEL